MLESSVNQKEGYEGRTVSPCQGLYHAYTMPLRHAPRRRASQATAHQNLNDRKHRYHRINIL